MASGNGKTPPTPGEQAKLLRDQAEDLKLRQTLMAAEAKEAEAGLAEIEKDLAQWEAQRPALDKTREDVAADVERLRNDVQSLPEDMRKQLDPLVTSYNQEITDLETTKIPGARQEIVKHQDALRAATEDLALKRAAYDSTRAEGRRKALDQLSKLASEADAMYDNRRRAEAYIQYKLQIETETEILEALPVDKAAQREALEKAYGDWLTAKTAVRDCTLKESRAKRDLAEHEVRLAELKEKRVFAKVLDEAAKFNADADKRGAPAPGAKTAKGKAGQEAGAQRGA
jgi:hypothetical protein